MSISDLSREAVGAALAEFEVRHAGETGSRRAAVAIALGTDVDGATACLLTVRPAKMRAHPGQFALPGGAVDAGETVVEAAIRELGEELGVEANPTDVVGRLDDYVTRSGYVITPIVLWIGERLRTTEPNPAEVAFVLRPTMVEVDAEPRFISIPESDKPVIQWPFRAHLIHAPTGAIVYQFREVVLHRRHTRIDQLEQPVFAWR
ncbi:NUDIX hydrolase [Antrihabitans stalactiti]|uniref:CoA pyrophosphatase n=1 Tax=Antrihabitans stalactiti TaxID=2584121 RepID=A0A848KL41_9NOCA|nr:CoA pyrophosphatase [Antrihabitans stalactiti]NMN97392.1 CoA pyrophosphatase [Antrihabitans stalactiti]